MEATIKLSDDLILAARQYGKVYKRSISKQIEYWSYIGKIIEDNPYLPYCFIKDILSAQNEVDNGSVTPYPLP
jgi:hypothetical protein